MSDLIETGTGKKGYIVEKYSPGTEGKIQKAANERLKEIKKAVSKYKAGGSVKKKKSSRKALRGGGCEIR